MECRIRGSIVVRVVEILEEESSGRYAQLLDNLPADVKPYFDGSKAVVSSALLPARVFRAMGETVIELWGEDEFIAIAGQVAVRDLSRGLKLVMRIASPKFVAERFPTVCEHYFSGVVWRNTLLEKNHLIAEISGAQTLHRSGCVGSLGWGLAALNKAGANLTKAEQTSCTFRGGSKCQFEFEW